MARRLFPWVALFFLTLSLPSTTLQAAIIPDDPQNPNDGWKDPRSYRPSPTLFLHGFSSGDPKRTWIDKKVDETLNEYFKNYLSLGPVLSSSNPQQRSQFSYLELLSFIDFTQPWRGQLIDRNSSVDTYQQWDPGDASNGGYRLDV